MAGNASYDDLLATTLANHRKRLTDNVFLKLVLFWWLTEKNKVRMEDGGHKIVEPLVYAENTGGGSYTEWQPLVITPQDNISAAEFPWRYIYDTIAISGQEEFKNQGRHAVLNLLKAKTMITEKSLRRKLNTQLHAAAPGADDWFSLPLLIGDHTDTTTLVGGIDCAVAGNEFWRSKVYDKVATVNPTHATLRGWFTTAYNDVADDADAVDAMLAAQDVHEFYESGLVANVQYQDVKAANAGFENVMFKRVPIFLDKQLTAGQVYGVNSDYMSVVGGKGRWFAQSKFSDGLNGGGTSLTDVSAPYSGAAQAVDGRYAVITTYGNLTVSNRSKHFKIVGIDTTP